MPRRTTAEKFVCDPAPNGMSAGMCNSHRMAPTKPLTLSVLQLCRLRGLLCSASCNLFASAVFGSASNVVSSLSAPRGHPTTSITSVQANPGSHVLRVAVSRSELLGMLGSSLTPFGQQHKTSDFGHSLTAFSVDNGKTKRLYATAEGKG